MPINIFICSTQEDEELLVQLKQHLNPLERQGLIRLWFDRTVRRSDGWDSQVMCHLTTSQIVLVLVSPAFLATGYCYDFELKKALELDNVKIIPIILRPCDWRNTRLGALQPLPSSGKPLIGSGWHTTDEAFHDITKGIRKAAEELKLKPLPVEKLSEVRILKHEYSHKQECPLKHACPLKPEYSVTDMAISANGSVLVTADEGGFINIWKQGSNAPFYTLTAHTGAIRRVAISPDGRTLVSGGDDRTIRVWDLFQREQTRLLEGHEASVQCVAMSSDERTLFSGSADQTVKVWDLSTGKIRRTHPLKSGTVYCLAISADGRTMISGSEDGTITVWKRYKPEVGEEILREENTLKNHTGLVFSIAISADGETLISGSADGTAKIWKVSTAEVVAEINAHAGSVAISPDEERFFTAGTNRMVRACDRTGNILRTFKHENPIAAVVISADNKTLVSADKKGTIKVWG